MYVEVDGKDKSLRGTSKCESENLVVSRQFAGRSTLSWKMGDAMLLDRIWRSNLAKNIAILGWQEDMRGASDPARMLELNKLATKVRLSESNWLLRY
jgi:hypothetical protein